nr:hypothetical protein [Solirubrobacterales bacterium]
VLQPLAQPRPLAQQRLVRDLTIARFRARHEAPLAELFSSVLSLCREAGLVKVVKSVEVV